jgi:hypothetical protein
MLIHLDHPAPVYDLCAHFNRSGFKAEPCGGAMICVTRPDAPSPEQERREVLLHLTVWDAMRPDAPASPVALEPWG